MNTDNAAAAAVKVRRHQEIRRLEAALADPETLSRSGERARQRALACFGKDRFTESLVAALQLKASGDD